MSASQKDIASKLNLSPTTVSRALQNHPAINAETRAKVAAAARKLGYQPPQKKNNGANGEDGIARLMSLGVLIVRPEDPRQIYGEVGSRELKGISIAARAMDCTLHVDWVSPEECAGNTNPLEVLPALRERAVAALVLCSQFSPGWLAALKQAFPCVSIVHWEAECPLDCIEHDEVRAVGALVEHLRGLGHQKIGFVNRDAPSKAYVQMRFAGYAAALMAAGLTFDPAAVINIPESSGEIAGIGDRVAAQVAQGVRAWVCIHDGLGYDLMSHLLRRGLRVPQDVSLCGFDNLAAPPGLHSLTSIDPPFEEMGASAVRRLLRRISHPNLEAVHLLHSGRLIEGESTGPLVRVAEVKAKRTARSVASVATAAVG